MREAKALRLGAEWNLTTGGTRDTQVGRCQHQPTQVPRCTPGGCEGADSLEGHRAMVCGAYSPLKLSEDRVRDQAHSSLPVESQQWSVQLGMC